MILREHVRQRVSDENKELNKRRRVKTMNGHNHLLLWRPRLRSFQKPLNEKRRVRESQNREKELQVTNLTLDLSGEAIVTK